MRPGNRRGENGHGGEGEREKTVRDEALAVSLLASFLVHGVVIVMASILIHNIDLPRENLFPINLVELHPTETSRPRREIEAPRETRKLPPPPTKAVQPKQTQPLVKNEITKSERLAPLPVPIREEPAKAIEVKPHAPVKTENAPSVPSGARVEDGGNEASGENLFSRGDIGIVPGTGRSGGGGGTAPSGVGRGSGAPGLPAQTVLRTNREAKPIQTAKAAYPAMALRIGLESDVALKIEVDAEGKVTKAEIIKGGGAGFDEEALKAVRQSRFEPAQKDGHNVPAEFTYIYRFRLQR